MLEVWLSLDHPKQEPQEPEREALGKKRVGLILAAYIPEAAEANIANPSALSLCPLQQDFPFCFCPPISSAASHM